MTPAETTPAQIAKFFAPKRRLSAGMTVENNNIPIGIIAEFSPIKSVETPLSSSVRDSSGKVIPNANPNTVMAEQAAIRLVLLVFCIGAYYA